MFERYTEKARRIIFFARYEASQSGSMYIEPGHLLLGLMREDRDVACGALKPHPDDLDALRRQLTRPGAEKISTSVDMSLSVSSKRILAYAAEESDKANDPTIATVHVLMGLLREQDVVATPFLEGRGITLVKLREQISSPPAAEKIEKKVTAMDQLQATLRRLGANPSAFSREGNLRDGHFSASMAEDGERVTRSHTFINGHEVRVIQRSKISEDGKALHYSIEIEGPGQQHRHEIDFPL